MLAFVRYTCAREHESLVGGCLLTAGLNKPPLILKKTHALTASEKPKLKLIYSSSEGFFCATCVITVVPVLVFEDIFATLQ